MNFIKLVIPAVILSTAVLNAQDYTSYNELLKKYAKPSGVNYDAWSANTSDKAALDTVLGEWAKIDSSKLKMKDQAAFRINLYNASMVDVVLDHYPLESVTKIGKAFSIFDKNFVMTPKGKISLNSLEKKTLLRDFPDARVHLAVNCASISCPPLRNEAFEGNKLEAQLNEQAAKFADSDHAVIVKGSTAYYSELFNWYASDFKTQNPATFLNKYRTKKLSTTLKKDWIKYDWGLNTAK
ncbi:DUF547 domain-containing protein [Rubritalea sp.]|uniref:DUF547 domain-containing protein n=1 Tax=Rubritalea sp. TaxID=2109375 RepID=UPI003EF64BAC